MTIYLTPFLAPWGREKYMNENDDIPYKHIWPPMEAPGDLPQLGNLSAREVLIELGEPMMWVADGPNNSNLVLYLCDIDSQIKRYLVTNLTDEELDAVKANVYPINQIFIGRPVWLAQRKHNGTWISANLVDLANVPAGILPKSSVTLYNKAENEEKS